MINETAIACPGPRMDTVGTRAHDLASTALGNRNMKKFLVVFTGTAASRKATGWDALEPKERERREQEGMARWMRWGEEHPGAIVENGGPLGSTKRVSRDGISDTSNNLAGYTIVQAESHAAAAAMFKDHPHFSIFPGDGVEIMECLPIPGT
jgi:hypothetical protein